MGCLLNTILFILLFGFIMALYVGTATWNQIKQMRDMFRGTRSGGTAGTYRKQNRQTNHKTEPQNSQQKQKIFTKDQGEYVDFQEIP